MERTTSSGVVFDVGSAPLYPAGTGGASCGSASTSFDSSAITRTPSSCALFVSRAPTRPATSSGETASPPTKFLRARAAPSAKIDESELSRAALMFRSGQRTLQAASRLGKNVLWPSADFGGANVAAGKIELIATSTTAAAPCRSIVCLEISDEATGLRSREGRGLAARRCPNARHSKSAQLSITRETHCSEAGRRIRGMVLRS